MLFIDMYTMKNFKNIRNLINEFVERGNNWGSDGDDDNPEQYMLQLMREMRKHPFRFKDPIAHTTRKGHEIRWENSLDAMNHISDNIAKHDNAYGENAVRYGEDSPQAMYHNDAGDKHSEIYEELRKHIENHPKIHPTLRTYAKRVFDIQHDVHDRKWSHEDNQQHLMDWSKGLRDNNHHHLHDMQQDFKNTPDMGYFLHKDEME